MEIKTSRGWPRPYGATPYKNGINFAVFSKRARVVSLCLFQPGKNAPYAEILLDPKTNRTGDVWHIYLYDIPLSDHYGYRVDGPYDPLAGETFDNRQILLDPYARLVVSRPNWGQSKPKDPPLIDRGVIYPLNPFDWEEDAPPNLPLKDLVIYEMHARGFTQDPSSRAKHRGTFLGIIEKIPHLKALGVNAIELLPIYEFNERSSVFENPETGEPLFNYWGYSTQNFFSPMVRYGTNPDSVIQEFKTLVKELHRNGIEIILDVVYNHTGEGDERGPQFSFKGFGNSIYYLLAPNGEYYNFTGCGNTMNTNHQVVVDLIRDSLRYWVTEMHVDGFRFDLASIFARTHDGIPLEFPPILEAITNDPILANTKLIAEPWDAGGLYQVGSFPGRGVWSEWNGKYRDNVRRFLKGTDGEVGNFATRLSGSEDLYGKWLTPTCSINFITAHDGFSLADLVSYNSKHNLENGEENRDGANDNESWNCGVEGETDDPKVLQLRERQRKNFLVALLVSQGVPMLLMGDEYGHTKKGNNNTWGHDSRFNWFQWDTLAKNRKMFRFFQKMIAFRKAHPILSRFRFLKNQDVVWHGIEPLNPDWNEKNRLIAMTLVDSLNHYSLYIACNAFHHEVSVHLPWHDSPWYQYVYTPLPSPKDIVSEKSARKIQKQTFTLAPYSSLILKASELPSVRHDA
ncbi:MAG: hypothetical protein K940chlam9_01318 [Chlamydiae bacterium]|nr:hypothetical protein [Chlamydiota bacterium]